MLFLQAYTMFHIHSFLVLCTRISLPFLYYSVSSADEIQFPASLCFIYPVFLAVLLTIFLGFHSSLSPSEFSCFHFAWTLFPSIPVGFRINLCQWIYKMWCLYVDVYLFYLGFSDLQNLPQLESVLHV